jgi:hypothetical protein
MKSQLYIAALMEVHEKSDILVTEEEREVMSIGFCFLS